LLDSIINKYQLLIKKFNSKDYFKVMKNAKKKRRLALSKIENNSNYELARKIFANYLELCFYLCKKKKIKTIYIHQTSLLTTNKDLSEYESEYFKQSEELGLYRNNNVDEDQKLFKKNEEIFKNDAHRICNDMGIQYIDFEKILKDFSKENIFYDNVHLTDKGTEILSKEISNYILRL